jgi:hypothetical protein
MFSNRRCWVLSVQLCVRSCTYVDRETLRAVIEATSRVSDAFVLICLGKVSSARDLSRQVLMSHLITQFARTNDRLRGEEFITNELILETFDED